MGSGARGRRRRDLALQELSVIIPADVSIGELIPIAELREHDLSLLIMAIAFVDTEDRRLNRWRILPRLASGLPEPVRGLGSGRQTGHYRPRQVGVVIRKWQLAAFLVSQNAWRHATSPAERSGDFVTQR